MSYQMAMRHDRVDSVTPIFQPEVRFQIAPPRWIKCSRDVHELLGSRVLNTLELLLSKAHYCWFVRVLSRIVAIKISNDVFNKSGGQDAQVACPVSLHLQCPSRWIMAHTLNEMLQARHLPHQF